MPTSEPQAVLTGRHFFDGDHACCEGAIAAGCRIAFGYPITPSTEVVERLAQRFPTVGGLFVQMEDEIASSIAIQGAVWGGLKALTASSGPGISLMMEHIGFAAMTETPCVFVNVQRAGPSTGLPTMTAQADMMQARWGSHGDYEIIALCPASPQECFDLTVQAFNLAERYRVPVLLMMDETVGHMVEKVEIPPAEQIHIEPRRLTRLPPAEYLPYRAGPDGVPDMAPLGAGYRFHVTGLTHDERGYPTMTAEAQQALVRRLVEKIRGRADEICRVEEHYLEEAELVIVAYGITARIAKYAAELAREKGLPVGVFRPVVVWPFPEKRLLGALAKARAVLVAEINLGQVAFEVERIVAGRVPVHRLTHAGGGLFEPQDILRAAEESLR